MRRKYGYGWGNWVMRCELGNICSRLSSGKGINASEISSRGLYPVFGGNGIRGYTDRKNFDGECAIIGRQGAYCGNVRYFSGEAYMTEHAVVVRANENNNTRYLAYVLSTMNLGRLSSQSAQPGISVRTLSQQKISLPPLDVQEKIAAILSPLDDKIELNRRINANLEEQARAIFKHWFIEREPSEKWQKGKLKDILNLKRNNIKAGGNEKLPYVPIDVIPMRTFALSEVRPNKEAKSSLITFSRDDIIIGAMRIYFHRVVLAPFNGITRTTCFTLRAFDDDYLSFCLLCCDQDSTINYAQSRSKGSTMPYAVWDGGLGDMDIIIPDKKTAREFNDIVLPMLRKIQASYNENNTLANIRDSLLPKLISGDIIP